MRTYVYTLCIGICYRILGRLDEAEDQFKTSSAKNPSYLAATYNLGIYIQYIIIILIIICYSILLRSLLADAGS